QDPGLRVRGVRARRGIPLLRARGRRRHQRHADPDCRGLTHSPPGPFAGAPWVPVVPLEPCAPLAPCAALVPCAALAPPDLSACPAGRLRPPLDSPVAATCVPSVDS